MLMIADDQFVCWRLRPLVSWCQIVNDDGQRLWQLATPLSGCKDALAILVGGNWHRNNAWARFLDNSPPPKAGRGNSGDPASGDVSQTTADPLGASATNVKPTMLTTLATNIR